MSIDLEAVKARNKARDAGCCNVNSGHKDYGSDYSPHCATCENEAIKDIDALIAEIEDLRDTLKTIHAEKCERD